MVGAQLIFPADGLNDCANKSMWERCDVVLPLLRHFAMKSPVAELDLKAEYIELVTAFLIGVRERRRPQRARVAETAKALARSQIWEQEILKHPLLLQVVSPASEPLVAPQPTEDIVEPQQTPTLVGYPSPFECQASDQELPQETTFPFECSSLPSAPSSPATASANTVEFLTSSGAQEPSPVSVADEFRQGVRAVLAINSPVLFENESVPAFVQLRRAALHAVQLPNEEFDEILHAEMEHRIPVLCFLIAFVNSNPIRHRQVCEVLNTLLICPCWSETRYEDVAHCFAEHTHPEVRALIEERPHTKRVGKDGGKEIGKKSDSFAKNAKKQFKQWIFGCGQKRGEGVSSPRALSRPGGA